jgi:peptidoglycan-associated lipoprotein
MTRFRPLLVGAAALALLVACGDDDRRAFHGEAGAGLDEGGFGNATMNNVLVQTGQRDHVVNLANRFATEVPSTITFAFDSAALDAAAQATLRRQADWIRQFPEVRFRVYGHTDLVGSSAYNQALGLRRAQAAVNYLVAQGIARNRLEALASFGETQPLIVTQDEERRNRRTVTEVSGFVQRHPTVMNGRYAQVVYREYVASAVPAPSLAAADAESGSGGAE